MEALFWSCLAGGILFALVSVILGDWLSLALDGALDFLSLDGHKVFQPTAIVGGITVFGGAGLLLHRYAGTGPASTVTIAILIAIVSAAGLYFLYIRPMERSENSVGYSIRDLAGTLAEVLVPVPAGGYGEVTLKIGGGVTHHIASGYEGESIPAGSKVVVVEVNAQEGTLLVSKVDF
ncbi:NfeD family protein [Paenibacillus methanolicus]|uniref:NfeD-like partner-binding protein n=1 Tax=Paenibacillus methanolicus TaxID=582686 RepID=A0A5S5BZS4_9BACL|nr:NfeD family protein [Paenibacillus methanolicus]TYP72691.1 NfeD-like partner-binding protein [Paenibacillus methanolicus]